jgi:hypothetical protein
MQAAMMERTLNPPNKHLVGASGTMIEANSRSLQLCPHQNPPPRHWRGKTTVSFLPQPWSMVPTILVVRLAGAIWGS